MARKKVNFQQYAKRLSDGFGQTVEWEKMGQSVEGVLKDIKKDVGGQKTKIYMIENSTAVYAVWGCHQIEKMMSGVAQYSIVKITFLGKKKLDSGNTVNTFDIFAMDMPEDWDIENDIYQIDDSTLEGNEE